MSPVAFSSHEVLTKCEAKGGNKIMYSVYLLKLSNESYYTGSTPNLRRRIQEHIVGNCLSTKNFRPVKMIWSCNFEEEVKALSFEKYLKSGSGQAFRNKHLI